VFSIAWNYLVVLELFFILIQLSFQALQIRKYKKFLKLLNDFDEDAKMLGVQVNFAKHKKTASVAVLTIFAIVLSLGAVSSVFYSLNGLLVSMNEVVFYIYIHKNFYKLMFSFQLSLVGFAVKDRFKLINDFLE
jgi:hypothetical protein